MKKIYGIIAALVLSVAGIAGIVFLGVQNYEVYLVLENEGVAVTDDRITQNLLQAEDEEALPEEVTASQYEMSDTVYEKNGKLYLGEDKAYMSSAYPLFVNEGSTLYCVTDSIVAVTEDFESVPTYQGLYISEGMSFNQDMERAYRENMLFLELPNGLYMNAMQMSVKQSGLPEVRLENNAILCFRTDKLSWYALDGDTFLYDEVIGLTEESYITINDINYNYLDLLELLGVYKDTTQTEGGEEGVTASPNATAGAQMTATPTPTFTPTPTPTPSPTPVPAEGDVNGDAGEGAGMTRPTATPTPVVIPSENETEDDEGVKPTRVPSDREWDGEKSKLPTMTPRPPLPALPAEDAEQVELPPEVEDVEAPEAPDESEPPEEEEKEKWLKPTVSLSAFSPEVYSIYNTIAPIENSAYLHNKGIVYQVYEVSKKAGKKDKLVTRKTAMSDGIVKISGLTPDTEYRVEVSFFYRTAFGAEEEKLASETLSTKPMRELPEIEVDFGLGEYYFPHQADLRNVELDYYEENNRYEDMLSAIKKVEIEFDKTGSLSKAPVYRFSSAELKRFKDRSTTDILTKEILDSSANYKINFVFYDAKGNQMPVKAFEQPRHVSTCKAAPVANIRLKKNEVKNVEVEIEIENKDKALIREGSLYLEVYNREGQPVYIQGKQYLELNPNEKNRIEFSNLLDFESYTLDVYADYDIGKIPGGLGTSFEKNIIIGTTKVLTAPLSSLGYAFFKVEVTDVSYYSANVSIALDTARTDYRLVDILSYCDLQIMKETDGVTSSEGITITYPDVSGLNGEQTEGDDVVPEEDEFVEAESDDTGSVGTEEDTQATLVAEDGQLCFKDDTMEYLREGNAIGLSLSGLDSASQYTIAIRPKVVMGTQENGQPRDVSTYYTPDSFRTLKITPTVVIKTSLCLQDSISLYDVSISDPDNTIISGPVTMYVLNSKNQNIMSQKITVGENTTLIRIPNLEPHHEYTFRFYVAQMNDGYDQSTHKENHEIYYYRYAETKEPLKLTTGEGINGGIQIVGIEEGAAYNVVKIFAEDIKINTKTDGTGSWKTGEVANRTGYRTQSYTGRHYYRPLTAAGKTYEEVFKIEYDFGRGGCNAFQVLYSDSGAGTSYVTYELYDMHPSNPAAKLLTPQAVEKTGTDTGGSYQYVYRTDQAYFEGGLVLTGQQTLYLKQTTAAGSKNHTALMGVQFASYGAGNGGEYSARLQTKVEDIKLELGDNPAFYLRVYSRQHIEGTETEYQLDDYRMYRYANNGQTEKVMETYKLLGVAQPTLIESVPFEGQDGICDLIINYPVAGRREYRVEMTVNVRGYVVTLGEVEFVTDYAVNMVEDIWDLYGIKQYPDASYVVTKDIELPMGWDVSVVPSDVTWQGRLDFQGHTLVKSGGTALIKTIGSNGVVENLRLRFRDDLVLTRGYRELFVNTNYGTIRNVQFEYNLEHAFQKTSTADHMYQTFISLNNAGGVIENFTVKVEKTWWFFRYGGMVAENRGIIRNGYVYGAAPMKMYERSYYQDNLSQFLDYKRAGAIAAYNANGAYIQNCYSNIDIYSVVNNKATDGGAGLIIGEQEGTVQNCFATGTVHYYDELAGTADTFVVDSGIHPLYDYSTNGPTAVMKNNYFYSEREFVLTQPDGARQIPLESLYDTRWHDALLNQSEASVSGQFDTSPAAQGFYPHVKLADGMLQDWVPLPALPVDSGVNLINATLVSQELEEARVVFTFNNPERVTISEVQVRWLDTEIKNQYMQDNFWRVEAVVTPSRTNPGYYSEYDITGFSILYKIDKDTTVSSTVEYTEKEYRKLPAEFYMPVLTVADWYEIKNNPSQNYRLYHDIDFSYIPAKTFVVDQAAPGFSGKLDGNGKTVRNMNLYADESPYAAVFRVLSGSISNLKVQNLNLCANSKNYSRQRGFVGTIKGNACLDNVHIIGAEIESTYYTGTLVGYADGSSADIINCSVQDVTIKAKNIGNLNQAVGGMVGMAANTGVVRVSNSFADKLKIEVRDAFSCSGTGGVFGQMTSGSGVTNVYVVDSTIYSAFKATGGIIGAVAQNSYFGTSRYRMENVLVDAVISSPTDSLGGFVGYAHYQNESDDVNGMFLGQIYITNQVTDAKLGRFEGSIIYTISTKDADNKVALAGLAKLFTTYTSYVDGQANSLKHETDWYKNGGKPSKSYTKYEDCFVYYSYDELCDINYYGPAGINLGAQFIIDEAALAEGKLPLLRNSHDGKVLENQSEHYFRKDSVKVESIKATPDSTSSNNRYYVEVVVTHPADYEITGLTFDENLKLVEGKDYECSPDESGESTYFKYLVDYVGWVDRYFLRGIQYRTDAGEEPEIEVMMDTGIAPQFLVITSAETWNDEMEAHGLKGYNVRLTGNLEFDKLVDLSGNPKMPVTGVILNRLNGVSSEGGVKRKISGITLSGATQSFISATYGKVDNLSFENISITSETDTLKDAVGIFGTVGGDMDHVDFQDITLVTKKTGQNGIIGSLVGKLSWVTMNGVTISATGDGKATGGLVGYLNTQAYIDNVTATNIVVRSNNDYVGGIFGYENGGSHITNCWIENFLVAGEAGYVGGIGGYALAGNYGNSSKNLDVKDGAVFAKGSYAGGIFGQGIMQNTDTVENIVENVFVNAVSTGAGGVMGHGYNVGMTTVKDSIIAVGSTGAGSIIGYGRNDYYTQSIRNTITSLYERGAGDTTNKVYSGLYMAQKDKVAAIGAEAPEGSMAKKYATDAATYWYDGKDSKGKLYWDPDTWKSATNASKHLGGAIGYGNSYLAIVVDCTVGAYNASTVGGIVGQHISHRSNMNSYKNAVHDTTVYGKSMVGGIAGEANQGKMYACYSDAEVIASGDYAGGILGKQTVSYSTADPIKLEQLYSVSIVSANSYAGGIVGYVDWNLKGYNGKFIAAGSVSVAENNGILHPIGTRYSNSGPDFDKYYIFRNEDENGNTTAQMTLKKGSSTVNVKDIAPGHDISTAQLKTEDAYKNLVGFSSDFNFDYVGSGYMPHAKNVQYKDKDGNIRRIMVPGAEQASGVSFMRLPRAKSANVSVVKLPSLVAGYSTGVDRLNLEFDCVAEDAMLCIEANGRKIADVPLTQRCYTLAYDYRTELTVTITMGGQTEEYTVEPAETSRNVMVWDADYFYITGEGIEGSRATIAGSFVHLCDGYALAANGDVYDVMKGTVSRKVNGVSLLKQTIPFDHVLYGEDRIETYYGYSVVNGAEREGMRLFVKDYELFAVSAKMSDAIDSVLVGAEGGMYTTVLYHNKLTDMTDVPMKLPKEFDNSGISQMTNNLNSDSCYVLVRYADGAVAGFNYRTGEMLPIETVHVYGTNFKNSTEEDDGMPGTNFASAYEEVKELEELVAESDWLENDEEETEPPKVMVSPTPVPGAEGQIPSETPSTESSDATSWPVSFGVTPTVTPIPEPEEIEENLSGAYGGTEVFVEPDEPVEEDGEVQPEQESGTLGGSGTAPEGTATQGGTGATGEMSGTDNQPRKVELDRTKKESTEEYIPYYDPDAGIYVLYEQSELLVKADADKADKRPVSVNEKVARSGRMVKKYNPLASDLFEVEEDNKIGIGLLAITLFVIAGLMVVLVIKQKPEKEKAE